MENIIAELNEIVSRYSQKIAAIAESDFSNKPHRDKWSRQEVLGHLIDSGQNNLRRFISGQYEAVPPKIFYDQDFWVKANDYQGKKSADVVQLWKLVNDQICSVLKTMPRANYTKTADVGRQAPKPLTIEFL